VFGQGVQQPPARLPAQSQHPRNGIGQRRFGAVGGQVGGVHQPDPMRVRRPHPLGGGQGQPGLAGTTRTHHGDQPVVRDQGGELSEFGSPADERGHRGGQVVGGRGRGARGWEVPVQAGCDELEEPPGVVEAAQPMRSEINQIEVGRRRSTGNRGQVRRPCGGGQGRGFGAEHLATVGGAGHPGGPVDLRADVLAVAGHGPTGVQAHPDPGNGISAEAVVRRPVTLRERPLGRDARLDGRGGVAEGHEEGITLGEKLGTAEVTQRAAKHRAVGAEDSAVRFTEHPGQTSRAFDVGEHEGHQPTR
jgi:hypothetical protein